VNWYVDWDCQLGDRWGVFPSVSLNEPSHWDLVCFFCLVDRGGQSCQFDCLRNGRKRVCNGFSSDAIAETVVARPHPRSESCDEDDLLCFGAVCEVRMLPEGRSVIGPVSPIFFSCFVIFVHDAIGNAVPRRQDITRELHFSGSWNSFQQLFCGRGKCLEKTVRKGLFSKDLSRKERDAMSAMLLLLPLIDTVRRGDVWCRCWRKARARSKCPAVFDEDEFSLFAHATVGVLSLYIPTCANFKEQGAMCSSTSHCSSTPAISRSEFVISPFLFLKETRRWLMSLGKASRHAKG
jgi:hypothetical protein